jgi:hypothetical protein
MSMVRRGSLARLIQQHFSRRMPTGCICGMVRRRWSLLQSGCGMASNGFSQRHPRTRAQCCRKTRLSARQDQRTLTTRSASHWGDSRRIISRRTPVASSPPLAIPDTRCWRLVSLSPSPRQRATTAHAGVIIRCACEVGTAIGARGLTRRTGFTCLSRHAAGRFNQRRIYVVDRRCGCSRSHRHWCDHHEQAPEVERR